MTKLTFKFPAWQRALLGLGCGLLVAGAAITWLGVSHRGLVASIQNASAGPLVIAAAGSLVLLALQSLRWWIVVRPVLDVKYLEAFKAVMVGFFGNVFLPARGGDLLRAQYLGKKQGVSRAKLLGTQLVDFWSDKWGWVVAFPVICLFGRPPPWMFWTCGLLGTVVVVLAAVLAVMGSRFGRLDAQKQSRGPRWLMNLRDGFAASHWKRLLTAETLVAPLPWLCEIAMVVIASRSVGLLLTPMQAFTVLTAINLAMVVPSPGNAGFFEAGGTLALVSLGASKEAALAFILLYHVTQVLPGIVGGAAILIANDDGISVLWRKNPALEAKRREDSNAESGE